MYHTHYKEPLNANEEENMETDRFYPELTIEEAELACREGTYPIGALVVDAKLTTLPTEDTLARSADMTCWMVYRLPLSEGRADDTQRRLDLTNCTDSILNSCV